MVECAALEMQYTGNRIEGSNPSLSATDALASPPFHAAFALRFNPAVQIALLPVDTGRGSAKPLARR